MTGKTTGIPPASVIPRFNSGMKFRSGKLQGFNSLEESAIPIIGLVLSANTSWPIAAMTTRCERATSSSPENHSSLRNLLTLGSLLSLLN